MCNYMVYELTSYLFPFCIGKSTTSEVAEAWRPPWRLVHYVMEENEATGDRNEVDPLSAVTVSSLPLLRDSLPSQYTCEKCGKKYKWKGSLRNHVRLECGKEPQFHCHMCPHKTYQKGNLIRHLALFHKINI
jgi:hypothetical protein